MQFEKFKNRLNIQLSNMKDLSSEKKVNLKKQLRNKKKKK